MAEIIKENKATMECACKELCTKMRNTALRCGIRELKRYPSLDSSSSVMGIIAGIYNLLGEYHCLPCNILRKRVRYVYDSIAPSNFYRLSTKEETNIMMLIAELETFVEGTDVS